MHIAPFLFTVKNDHTRMDFMGYLRYQTSRRNKDKVRVHICIGGDMEFIREFQFVVGDIHIPAERNPVYRIAYVTAFAQWFYENGHMEECFGLEEYELPKDMTSEKFLRMIEAMGATLRFW